MINSDRHLLSLARLVLERNGFVVQESLIEDDGDVSVLIAENDYFLLALAAGQTVDDLLVQEGYASALLSDRLADTDIGSKRWDSYVVLLSGSDAERRGTAEVVGVQYNTRSLRRILSLGVPAHEDGVVSALATFLPLPEPPAGGLPQAFEELVAHLAINGVGEPEARSAITEFRSTRNEAG